MNAPPSPVVARPHSAFAPFANRAFRLLWTANVLSNVGGWMQTTGAAWEMTSLTQEPIFVALLAAAGTLPMFLFCFFAGILADRFDRRRYIVVCQVWMMGVAATLAVLAWFGQLTHWNLLALAFCMGLGNAMNAPAWHAVVPEIVSGPLLRPAIALNSAGFNLARTVGPVLGQILLGLVGVFLLFAINACTYIGVIFAMASWRRSAEARASQRREGFVEAARTGIAFVRGSGELKAVFARGLCFFVPGIAISTLLPVIGRCVRRRRGGGRHPDVDRQPPAEPRPRQHLGDGAARGGDADRRTRHDALCGGRLHRRRGGLLDHRDRQQRHGRPDDPPQLHAGQRHGGTPDGVFRRHGRGLAVLGKDRHAVRHASLTDRLGCRIGALHGARRVDPLARFACATRLTRLCVFSNTRRQRIFQAGKNPLVTASISCI